ncbi:MAG: hypothetical protein GY807_02290 [Gammaproteobacteria bacterium]|nr:hypothetical protein [Gammaproteobacteria bacterium]
MLIKRVTNLTLSPRSLVSGAFFMGLLVLGSSAVASGGGESRLSDEPIPLQIEAIPERPAPILNLGASFLETGTLSRGIELPTGAVWQPSLLLFGTLRSALQTFDDGIEHTSEWANRLDLFAQLRLSGTESL